LIEAWAKLWEIFLVVEAEQVVVPSAAPALVTVSYPPAAAPWLWLFVGVGSEEREAFPEAAPLSFLPDEVMLLVTLALAAVCLCCAWSPAPLAARLLVTSCRGPARFLELCDRESRSSRFMRFPLLETELVLEL